MSRKTMRFWGYVWFVLAIFQLFTGAETAMFALTISFIHMIGSDILKALGK